MPASVKPSPYVFHILFLSGGASCSAEVTAGWHLSEECFDDPHPCDVTHYTFAGDHDLLNILKLRDKVREGIFRVVIVLPPAATWSRARLVGPGGQPTARSRSRPWGIPEATSPLYNGLPKFRSGSQQSLSSAQTPTQPSFTFFQKISESTAQLVQPHCGPCKN